MEPMPLCWGNSGTSQRHSQSLEGTVPCKALTMRATTTFGQYDNILIPENITFCLTFNECKAHSTVKLDSPVVPIKLWLI